MIVFQMPEEVSLLIVSPMLRGGIHLVVYRSGIRIAES